MNDIDRLMNEIETINFKSPEDLTPGDIDTLIAYHRHNRARLAAGEKPKRATSATSAVDISDVMDRLKTKIAAPAPKPNSPIKIRPW
jgi:hypothetical protein